MVRQRNNELYTLPNVGKYRFVVDGMYRGLRRVSQSDGRSQAEQEEDEKKRLEIESRYEPILKSLEVSWEDKRSIHNFKNKCRQAIQQAFSHYLYRVTHSKGGRLTHCWVDATIIGSDNRNNYGAHDPSSPEELHTMMSVIRSGSLSVKDTYLRQAHNASNALVLKSNELTKIAREFFSSVNLSSLYDSLN